MALASSLLLAAGFASSSRAATLSLGVDACMASKAGAVSCWGIGYNGGLGPGRPDIVSTPVPIADVAGAVSVSTSDNHGCAALASGTVKCWGALITPLSEPRFEGLTGVADVAVAEEHACALLQDGTVDCWGSRRDGRLGDGSSGTGTSDTPVPVTGLTDAVAIAAGGDHTCALRRDHSVACWGGGLQGVLGNGSTKPSRTPATVTGITDAVSVAASKTNSCAVHASGQVSCWGSGRYGRLGSGKLTAALEPVLVAGIHDARAVSSGFFHSCALRASGRVSCWGYDYSGELGDRKVKTQSATPVSVVGLQAVSEVAVGSAVSCARRATGRVLCWGEGGYGLLGNGSTKDALRPTAVTGT